MNCSSCEHHCECCEFGFFEYGYNPCSHCEDANNNAFELMNHIHFCPITGEKIN